MSRNRTLALVGTAGALAAPVATAMAAEQTPTTDHRASTTLRAPLAGDLSAREAMRDHQHDVLLARLRKAGDDVPRRAHLWSNERLRREIRDARRAKRHQARFADTTASPQLEAIAACESGGDPTAIGGGGAFRGKYQFTYATWQAVGGSGDPAAAPEAEQDARAAQLLATSGTGNWPVCGA